MTDTTTETSVVQELLESHNSRRHFLTGAAAAAASFGIAPAVASAAALEGRTLKGMPARAQDIFNIAITAEAAAVTVLYNVHVAVNENRFSTAGIAIPAPTLVKIVRGILRQEQDHFSFLYGAGARPLQTRFNAPAEVFQNARSALSFLETADTLFTAAYMAANREFANGGHGKLAQYTYQIGGTESEHRALARAGLGLLPNNMSFERNLFRSVNGAVNVLSQLGVLRQVVPYPGAAAVHNILATSGDRDPRAGVTDNRP